MRVLVVEDDEKMAGLLRRGLEGEGLAVDIASCGEDAIWMAGSRPYDAILLDMMLPGIDGFATCKAIRAAGIEVPVLMLTARDSIEDRVAGLDTGADDYLVKPFDFDELFARIRALRRRGPTTQPAVLAVGDLTLDPSSRAVARAGVAITLSATEYALLDTLMRHPGKIFERIELLDAVWDEGYENRSNIIDVYIRYLREKVDRPFGVRSIETVRGIGYRLRPDGG